MNRYLLLNVLLVALPITVVAAGGKHPLYEYGKKQQKTMTDRRLVYVEKEMFSLGEQYGRGEMDAKNTNRFGKLLLKYDRADRHQMGGTGFGREGRQQLRGMRETAKEQIRKGFPGYWR